RMLCHRGATTTVADWVQPRKIVIISGEAGQVGATTARFLVSVLLALVATELLARPVPTKTFLLLDEAQWYGHESTAEIFRLGRRANVHLCLATQSLAALPEAVAEAARTNAADLLLFRGSPEEAREFHRWNPAVTEDGLLSLPRGVAMFLSGKGERTGQVTIAPWRSREQSGLGLAAARKNSRAHWVTADQGAVSEVPETRADAPDPSMVRSGTLDLLIRVLRVGLSEGPPGGIVSVPLQLLRELVDPSGEVVRAAGRLLANSGSLVDSRDGPNGRIWVVRDAGLETLLEAEMDSKIAEHARTVWRALSERSGDSEV
ncbi:MAG: hypothetical protein L3J93_05210, partial [Thermoplasmata archaeon]|nr:hypothetical protein [Thermoplasmata archaeon]